MKAVKSILPNGLRVICVPMPTLKSATITVWVKTGSRFEDKKVNGISHFLEHMVFKGSKKRPTAMKIAEAVDAIGGEFNAATSKEWTNFYIQARAANLETAFDVLSDMVLNPILSQEEIEKEKGVITEEIAMYEDTPLLRISDVFEQLIFEGNSLGWDIIGSSDTVRAIKRSDFVRFREKYYFPENILITVAGGIKQGGVLALTEKYFGKLSRKKGEDKIKGFISKQKKPQIKLHAKKKEQAHFILGFLGTPRGHPDRFIEAVLASILGGGMSSRLFSEIREKRGLAYAVKTSVDHYLDAGHFSTYAGVDLKRIDEAIKVAIGEHYELASGKHPILPSELKKAKEYVKGHLALALEDTKDVDTFFGEQELFLKKLKTPEEVFRKVDEVVIDDVLRVAKGLFRPEKLNLAIIGPYKIQEHFEKLLA